MRFAIAGGGTGGHLFPALAVGEVLHARGHEIMIFISEKDVDALAIKDRTEFRFEKLPGVGLPKLFSLAMLGFVKRFNDSLAPCRRLYRKFQPHAVLGMGGFTSTAPILAGRLRKIPTFVHESNAIPGKANRLNARMTNAVLLGFEDCCRYFPTSRCIVTGTPIRKSLTQRDAARGGAGRVRAFPGAQDAARDGRQPGRARHQRSRDQGAAARSRSCPCRCCISPARTTTRWRRRITGGRKSPRMSRPFCHQMEMAYSAADLALSRSGAASLSELSHFGIPSVLIPYPFAAENHQALNAAIFARKGAAVIVEQGAGLRPRRLRARSARCCGMKRKLALMSKNARALAPENAAESVAKVVERAGAASAKLRGEPAL